MTAYKTFYTIEDPDRVILSNLPFQKGQRVRVVILTEEDDRSAIGQEFRQLFRETQSLPGIREITEANIETEIATYRRGE